MVSSRCPVAQFPERFVSPPDPFFALGPARPKLADLAFQGSGPYTLSVLTECTPTARVRGRRSLTVGPDSPIISCMWHRQLVLHGLQGPICRVSKVDAELLLVVLATAAGNGSIRGPAVERA
jgi:hypothetical protein